MVNGIDKQMQQLHTLELMIALEIKRICEKNRIPYFLTAGTLLGAERHGGFIPWDDDMDIGMLRGDYERFLTACREDLGAEYLLQTWDTDHNYPFSFGKIRLKGTHITEGFSENTHPECNGIFVDIFPFDNVPDDPKERKKQERIYFWCKRLLWIKKGMGTNIKKGSLTQKLKYYGFRLISAFVSYKVIKEYYQKAQQRYNDRLTEKVVTDGSYSYAKESLPRRWVTNLESIPFENVTFSTFCDRAEYLTYFYGDYWILPPEDQRNRHDRKGVDFGLYGEC